MRRKSPQVARDEATEEFHIQAKQRNLTITERILYCVFSSFLSLHFVTMLMARLASQLCARFIREDKRIESYLVGPPCPDSSKQADSILTLTTGCERSNVTR
jgi:hypothetical protein